MTHGHGFWFLLVWICVAWYATLTIYVGVKGSFDILQMLRDLKSRDDTTACPTPNQTGATTERPADRLTKKYK